MVKDLCTTVKIAAIIVKGMRSISESVKRGSRALALPLLQHRLVRILSRAKIPQIHTRQNLKLCIGRPGAY